MTPTGASTELAADALRLDEVSYQEQGANEEVFLFGLRRNMLDHAFQTASPIKSKAETRQVTVNELVPRLQQRFLGPGEAEYYEKA